MAGFRHIALLSATLLALHVQGHAQTFDLTGQLSAWVTVKSDETQIGARYIPELSLARPLSEAFEISAEAAFNAYGFTLFDGIDDIRSKADLDPYRLWVRLASSQFEARAGLQKISFGPAALLRPLMWFDSIDPRDPLQLTDGVYGLLGRYYFLNNANIWVWGLYGNDDPKGWETLPTDKGSIEYGCRFQMPVRAGEIGFSYHHRRVAPQGTDFGAKFPAQGGFPEERFGIDGKWDIVLGLWFEGTVTYQGFDAPEPRYRRLLTVGADYTFDIGNGLHLLGEHLLRDEAKEAFGPGNGNPLSALSVDYPLNLLDKITAIVYYDWGRSEWSRFLQWQRTYDKWKIYLSAFWNPDRVAFQQGAGQRGGFGGRGVHFMLVFNH